MSDTGIGLSGSQGSKGLGTGLANLRERLQLVFSGQARLSLTTIEPHGFLAEIDFPAQLKTPTNSLS